MWRLIVAALLTLSPPAGAISTGQTPLPTEPVTRGVRVRALAAGWGDGWRFGIPGWGKTRTDIEFLTVHPGLGWLVIDRGEVFGEVSVFAYYRPYASVGLGPLAVGGRYHLAGEGRVLPFLSGGAGFLVTPLDVPELDRTFNFQVFYGVGVRWHAARSRWWRLEVRNHHISNAGTAGANLGVNALLVLAGVEWLLQPASSR
jgi:hypothetical protein